jgi:hypothetical protein
MPAKKVDLCIEQGKTFTRVVRWETSPMVYNPISAIAQVAPALITSAGHGVLDGWRVAIINAKGMVEINAKNTPPRDSDLVPATYVSGSQISLNSVSAADFTPYTSGGYIAYWSGVDLTGYTARMTIKDRVGGLVLKALVLASGTGLTIDTVLRTTTINITAVDTAAFTWLKGVYDLEMVSASGIVTATLTGAVNVTDEVTT